MIEFTDRKYTLEEGKSLKQISLDELIPYRFIYTPLFLFLKLNQKFIILKKPLQFFTHEEIQKLKENGSQVFLTPHTEKEFILKQAGRSVLTVWDQNFPLYPNSKVIEKMNPLFRGKKMIEILSPLFHKNGSIDPYLLSVWLSSFMPPCDHDALEKLQNESLEYEKIILQGSLILLFSMLLGYDEIPYLQKIQNSYYQQRANSTQEVEIHLEVKQIISFVEKSYYPELEKPSFSSNVFKLSKTSKKIESRIKLFEKLYSSHHSSLSDDFFSEIGVAS